MPDYVKMSSATLGILMAQQKILAEPISNAWGNREEMAKAGMDRKLLYMGQEIILDETIPERQVMAADTPAIGENRFKAPSPRAKAKNIADKEQREQFTKSKRKIIF